MMAAEKTAVLLIGPDKPVIVGGLKPVFDLLKLPEPSERESFFADCASRVRGMAVAATLERIGGPFMSRFPRLEIIASFGVGYDHVDAAWAGAHGITVTNTPDVLTEEVADTALGLLLCTARELPHAERYLRAGKWTQGDYPLSKATLRDRTVGLVGLGRIGQAIARRLDAMHVPAELMAMEHVVLFPHLGSASIATREKMDQLVVDNLLAWAAGRPPLTPVAETPWPPPGHK
jgi:lactate dehydrogenase-like 2-hydroxyacid dehydrogenase